MAIVSLRVRASRSRATSTYGDGSQTRSFCCVQDEVEGLYELFHSSWTDPMNVGNPNEFTILELAEAVLDEVPTASEIVHRPLPEDDPRVRRPDISLAREFLGWEPETSLRQGLRKTVPYFRERVEEGGGGGAGLALDETTGGRVRYGDWFGAAADPTDRSAWLVGEYVIDPETWGAWVGKVAF